MLVDHSAQSMSHLVQCFYQKMRGEHILASPYHTQTNGLYEQFNCTLQQMRKAVVKSQEGDRILPIPPSLDSLWGAPSIGWILPFWALVWEMGPWIPQYYSRGLGGAKYWSRALSTTVYSEGVYVIVFGLTKHISIVMHGGWFTKTGEWKIWCAW